MTTTWTSEELAYLAGIIDGEGCITFHRRGGTNAHICATQLQVGNTDLRLLQWIQVRFGGSVKIERRMNTSHQTVWRWIAHVDNLEEMLAAVLPYLVIKRDQAELLLAYRKTLAPTICGHRARGVIAADVKRERQRLMLALTELNKRGA